MSKYRIGVYEEQSGYVIIEAKTKKKAEGEASYILNKYGLVGFEDFDVQHREINVLDIEKI